MPGSGVVVALLVGFALGCLIGSGTRPRGGCYRPRPPTAPPSCKPPPPPAPPNRVDYHGVLTIKRDIR